MRGTTLASEFVTIRRWSLREGADESKLVTLVRDAIIPAYKRQPGCLRLTLLRLTNGSSYLATTHWQDRAAFETWAGPAGEQWRDAYRPALEQWLALMAFNEEWDAEEIVAS